MVSEKVKVDLPYHHDEDIAAGGNGCIRIRHLASFRRY